MSKLQKTIQKNTARDFFQSLQGKNVPDDHMLDFIFDDEPSQYHRSVFFPDQDANEDGDGCQIYTAKSMTTNMAISVAMTRLAFDQPTIILTANRPSDKKTNDYYLDQITRIWGDATAFEDNAVAVIPIETFVKKVIEPRKAKTFSTTNDKGMRSFFKNTFDGIKRPMIIIVDAHVCSNAHVQAVMDAIVDDTAMSVSYPQLRLFGLLSFDPDMDLHRSSLFSRLCYKDQHVHLVARDILAKHGINQELLKS